MAERSYDRYRWRTNVSSEEAWRDVIGYEGHYQISDQGRLRSLRRTVMFSRRGKLIAYSLQGKILNLKIDKDGYSRARLWKDGVVQQHAVHRLVLMAFVGPCPQGMESRHLDGKPTNNSVGNLVWDTHFNNIADRVTHGTAPRGERSRSAKLTEDQVREIRHLYSKGGVTRERLAVRFGVSPATVSHITTRRNWRHVV